MTTTRVDFVLYGNSEDHDSDGLPDSQEDTRPDGVYNSAEDLASYTNADTDADGFDDYVEVFVTHTGPGTSNSYLHCDQTIRAGGSVVIRWASAAGVNYWIQRNTDLRSTNWVEIAGPIGATGPETTYTNAGPPANASYRIRIPY
jgi:hypothetical protein